MKKNEKPSHIGILFLLTLAGVLLLAPLYIPEFQRFAGWVALIWALGLIFSRFFQDKTGKSHEELSKNWREKFREK